MVPFTYRVQNLSGNVRMRFIRIATLRMDWLAGVIPRPCLEIRPFNSKAFHRPGSRFLPETVPESPGSSHPL